MDDLGLDLGLDLSISFFNSTLYFLYNLIHDLNRFTIWLIIDKYL
jgi:hypothetical protein